MTRADFEFRAALPPETVEALVECVRALEKHRRVFRELDFDAWLAHQEAHARSICLSDEGEYRDLRRAIAELVCDPALAHLRRLALGDGK